MLQRSIHTRHPDPGTRSLFSALLALSIVATSGAQEAPLQVHTLANEGVALTDGRQTVLIDALFTEGVRGYRTLDAATRTRLVEGQLELPPVALVLATHVHRDHFDADLVLDFLARHRDARLVSTPQVARALNDRLEPDGDPALGSRIHGLLPREGQALVLDRDVVGGFDGGVTLLDLHHGRDRDPPIQNLGILIEMAGVRALHIGDTEVRLADVQELPWKQLDVDVGLFPYWFLVKSHYLEVTQAIDPDHLVALHVPARDAPASYFWPARSLDGLVKAIRAEYPDALVALEPGQQRMFRSPRAPAPP